MYPVYLFVLAIISALIIIWRKSYKSEEEILKTLLLCIIFFNVGIGGLIGFLAHSLDPDATAKGIGWAPGSPFQLEIAAANLGIGVLGVLSPFFKPPFWLATVIGSAIFILGAAVVHVKEWRLGDVAPYNWGVFVWVGDILIPIVYVVLMAIYWNKYHSKHNEDRT